MDARARPRGRVFAGDGPAGVVSGPRALASWMVFVASGAAGAKRAVLKSRRTGTRRGCGWRVAAGFATPAGFASPASGEADGIWLAERSWHGCMHL